MYLIELESLREKHMLALLIETTRALHSEDDSSPLDLNEFLLLNNIEESPSHGKHLQTESSRSRSLKLLQLKQSKEYEQNLSELIQIVQKASGYLVNLNQKVKVLRESSEMDLRNQVNEWKNNVLGYIKNMNENSEKSKGTFFILNFFFFLRF